MSDEDFHFKPPDCGTESACAFFRASEKDLWLFIFICDLALHGDFAACVARRALDGQAWDNLTPMDLARSDPGPLTRRLRHHRQELLEMMFSRAVDNFQIYLVDVLRQVLRKRPEILKNRKDLLSLERILEFPTIDDLVQSIVEKKVSSLSDDGFEKLEHWFASKGIPFVVRGTERPNLVEAIATRNVIVHNRGRIDQRYLDRVKDSKFKVGELRTIDVDDLFQTSRVLQKLVAESDRAIVQKFDLMTVAIGTRAGTDGKRGTEPSEKEESSSLGQHTESVGCVPESSRPEVP
jgi:hypothetical protein